MILNPFQCRIYNLYFAEKFCVSPCICLKKWTPDGLTYLKVYGKVFRMSE